MKDLDKERELILESLDLLLQRCDMGTSLRADELREKLRKCKQARQDAPKEGKC